MDIKYTTRKLANRLGFDLVKTDNVVSYPPARRMKLISSCGINRVLDVGANVGQFVEEIKKLGYKGRIVSFEPLNAAFQELVKRASNDPNWETVNIALGNEDSKSKINVSENSFSSSLLDIKQTHLEAMASARFIGKEEITIRKMDSIFHQYVHAGDRIYLKLDAQGYEKHVIDGAEKSLEQIMCVQMEMSLVPLFENELLMADLVNRMAKKGFILWSLEDAFINPETGQLLQVNGIFVNNR